ncbi:hypothetical protein FNV43_RR18528 [Rhamnella rubrinervis]|uniref:NAD-dependent epimerase/dehydratase domain-containing protein n=1 Tax=Rhamnella rubrinervis TaxID=2594499 RepID=A0A8K0EAU6_9ROSA|nr:hypothetical protein FNV43_RR18265 [Rhamnella rubrinervis]KAF3440245.1 hypothetical protein FNV43_RR18528 [Rhamnella rubrinervis]
MESDDKGLVCVTGGTGYVASWLIMRLLQQGYTVRTTLRPHSGQRDLSFLTSLPGATEKLHLFHADLNEPDSFRAAIEGCTGVFHVAHPVGNINAIPEDELAKMTVEGTLGILKVCAESKTVKRVVYTSSAATVVYSEERREVVDENTWSDIDFTGNETHYKHLEGTSMVHVDDVASAHIHVFENPNAKGRYICSNGKLSLTELSVFLSAKYPDIVIPTVDSLKDIKGFSKSICSSKKLVDSGFKFKYSLDDVFDGAIQSCKEKGFIS